MDTADKLEIHDCIMKYARFTDERAFQAVGELLGHADLYIGDKLIASRDSNAVTTLFEKARYVEPGTTEAPMRHLTTNVLIDATGSLTAIANSYAMVFKVSESSSLRATTMAVYDDKFEKIDGYWRFSERRIKMEYSE